MSPFENLAAQQACMVYLIMCIVDYSSINAGYGQELTRILFVGHFSGPRTEVSKQQANLCFQNFCVTFKGMFGGHGSESESANPSLCWEDWIFAESRRRYVSEAYTYPVSTDQSIFQHDDSLAPHWLCRLCKNRRRLRFFRKYEEHAPPWTKVSMGSDLSSILGDGICS